MADCTCAPGVPVGWRRIPGGGRFPGGFGPGFGGFGGFGASNNNNNNNNNNNANNANNMMGSMMSNLMGLTNTGLGLGLGGFPGFPGFGFPGMGGCFSPGFPGFGFPGCGPGFGPPGCCCPGPCDCSSSQDPCRSGFCVRQFRIISPEGRECTFPVRVPWWCCGPTGATGTAESTSEDASAAQAGKSKARGEDGMSASQLLLQRYMISNPPRAFDSPETTREQDRQLALREQAARRGPDYGREYGIPPGREPPEHIEIIPCPDCDDNGSPAFQSAVQDFHKSAVLIPSEEA